MRLPQLRRVRWAVRATLALGVAASVSANVLHAQPNPISQAIAAWPPLALLLTVELISRVPVHRRTLAMARWGATATIAGIAAWVSYWHMAAVAARYGETGASAYLLPLSVDGLIIVASVCLVELGGRIGAEELSTGSGATADGTASTVDRSVDGAAGQRATEPTHPTEPTHTTEPARATASARATGAKKATGPTKATGSAKPAAPRQRRPATETAALAAAIEAVQPDATDADIARQLGISTSRLRTIRRETRQPETAAV